MQIAMMDILLWQEEAGELVVGRMTGRGGMLIEVMAGCWFVEKKAKLEDVTGNEAHL